MTVRGFFFGIDWSRAGNYLQPLEDVTPYVAEGDLTVSAGRDTTQQASAIPAGTLDFALQEKASSPAQYQFTPEAGLLAGRMLPGTPGILRLDVGAVSYPLMVGSLDSFDYDADAGQFVGKIADAWGKPGQEKLSTPVYTGMRTGDLINVVLDAIGWTGRRDIDPGATVVPFWWEEGTDATTAIQKLIDSEGPPAIGYVYGGVFVFRDRHHRLLASSSLISQGTFTVLNAGATPVVLSDSFTRTTGSGGFGTPDMGPAWAPSGSGSAFSVSSGAGQISLAAVSTEQVVSLPQSLPDVYLAATFRTSATAAGGNINAYLVARRTDDNNRYMARLAFDSSGSVFVGLEKFVGGSVSGLGALVNTGYTYTPGAGIRLEFQVFGSTLRARAYPVGSTPPTTWQASQTDTDLAGSTTAQTSVGLRSILSTGNTNTLPVTVSVDDFAASVLGDFKILDDSFHYTHGQANIINTAAFDIDQRLVGQLTPVWSTDSPISISAGQTVAFVINASDPFVNAQVPAAASVFDASGFPLNGDYTITTGSISSITISRTSGQSLTLTITAGGSDLLISHLQVRASPITVARTITVSAQDAGSAAQGVKTWPGTLPWANQYDALAIAQRIVSLYARARIIVVFDIEASLVNALGASYLAQFAARQVSDRITVRHDWLGVAGDFYIEKVERIITSLSRGATILRITAETATAAGAANPFTFDLAGSGFDQGQFAADGIDNPGVLFRFDTAGLGFNQGRFAS